MIFRDHTGKLVDIKKLDYINDKDYYNTILRAKKSVLAKHGYDEKKRMLDILISIPCKKT